MDIPSSPPRISALSSCYPSASQTSNSSTRMFKQRQGDSSDGGAHGRRRQLVKGRLSRCAHEPHSHDKESESILTTCAVTMLWNSTCFADKQQAGGCSANGEPSMMATLMWHRLSRTCPSSQAGRSYRQVSSTHFATRVEILIHSAISSFCITNVRFTSASAESLHRVPRPFQSFPKSNFCSVAPSDVDFVVTVAHLGPRQGLDNQIPTSRPRLDIAQSTFQGRAWSFARIVCCYESCPLQDLPSIIRRSLYAYNQTTVRMCKASCRAFCIYSNITKLLTQRGPFHREGERSYHRCQCFDVSGWYFYGVKSKMSRDRRFFSSCCISSSTN
ncbi:hypothetical protein ARMSODRAFT_105005 [Armillaria solidipes]|uniref:Uncharacterized protein n=1 Tax=Armillaria solidipes TaxID=1076256 RepID=A0A2H3AUT7_9AGAR|nr:hypothetical protein ARMSODRAFT_105005 [Armillaria solidipes]